MQVITVSSQAQHGKDTVANRLALSLNKESEVWKRASFAESVKRVFEETFDVNRDFIEEWKVKSECPPGFDLPIRKSLQFIGDGFRQIKSTIWVDLAFRDSSPKLYSDGRYPNEWKRTKQEGGLNILLGRPDRLNDDPNGSESLIRPYVVWALDHFPDKFNDLATYHLTEPEGVPEHFDLFDVFIRNDSSKEDLYEIVDNQLVQFVQNFKFKENNAIH